MWDLFFLALFFLNSALKPRAIVVPRIVSGSGTAADSFTTMLSKLVKNVFIVEIVGSIVVVIEL